jgi:hypothetical protein
MLRGEKALEFAMDTLTSFFRQNGTMQAPVARICCINTPTSIFVFTDNGYSQCGVPLSVTMNVQPLNNLPDLTLAGSLLHAWFHRMGYRYPFRQYTTYLSSEASMCVMRGNEIKSPGIPDSVFTRFFD